MDRRSALVLLVVFGIGVFLAGLELIVTAVALPSILVDLVDPTGGSVWIELRKASWIINAYLLAYVVTMPLAGRLADLWGARRLFMGALGSDACLLPDRSSCTVPSRRGAPLLVHSVTSASAYCVHTATAPRPHDVRRRMPRAARRSTAAAAADDRDGHARASAPSNWMPNRTSAH